MQLSYLRIKNFKSFKDECINVGSHHALVGANNSGKSGVLKALDFCLIHQRKISMKSLGIIVSQMSRYGLKQYLQNSQEVSPNH